MKFADIQKKNEKDLKKFIEEKKEELRTFRFGVAGSRVKDLNLGKKLRADIRRATMALADKVKESKVAQ